MAKLSAKLSCCKETAGRMHGEWLGEPLGSYAMPVLLPHIAGAKGKRTVYGMANCQACTPRVRHGELPSELPSEHKANCLTWGQRKCEGHRTQGRILGENEDGGIPLKWVLLAGRGGRFIVWCSIGGAWHALGPVPGNVHSYEHYLG